MRILFVILIAVSGWIGVQQYHAAQRDGTEESAVLVQAGVVVYVAPWCDVCDNALEHLDARGVDYAVRDIEASPEAYDAYRARGGSGGLPLIQIQEETLMGFNPETVDARLLAAHL